MEAAFFIPHTSPGMDVLDCGCGPGSITVGLAEVVSPGKVTGIDIEAVQVERAQSTANDKGVTNIDFQVASIYELPFPDSSFDAVFSHAVLEHLGDPLKALSEMHRVLKSGGVIGVRDVDLGTMIHDPHDPLFELGVEITIKVWQHNGGDPYIGRRLKAFLRQANFVRIETFGSLLFLPTQFMAASNFVDSDIANKAVELGLADRETLENIAEARHKLAEHPDYLAAMAFFEVVGWKE